MRRNAGITACASALLLAAATFAFPATAAPSGAESCTSHQVPSSGYTPTDGSALDEAPVRSGPHSTCSVRWYLDPGEDFVYWCYVYNESGNSWTFGYAPEGGKYGWVYDPHLADYGSKTQCP
ncbi:hypothetical protein [Streptomyces sp. NPDC004783]|uniref:hypothetical protein n=1 Tax=Streptomyces sp. NPDC004783 TaxID=3154459 RepID=UPI0033A3C3E9